ncbi:MAG: proton-conducting transporter membrane subunit [Chloroflexota bacterium]
MSVLILVLIALPGGLMTSLLARRRNLAFAVGLATAVLSAIAAASIDAADVVPIAGSQIGGSDGLRTLAVAWAASVLLFGVLDALLDFSPGVLGPSLVGLAFGASALAVQDPGIGFALVGAGAVLTAVIPISMARGDAESGPALAVRTLRPLIASVALTLLVVAWGASPAGPFNVTGISGVIDPALELTMGLALLALAAAVVLRLGAIPGHAWVARFAEAMPASAVPPLLGWGAAAFALVALGWIDVTLAPLAAPLNVERSIITVVAVAGIVLGGLAAILHEDIEHVLAYAIVQDAGVALLAFATSGATAASAGRDWILAAVAVKAGLAAWVHVTRVTFGTNRRLELRGWARRAPLLGIAFGLVIIGAIGMPTFAGFEARATLIRLALPGPVGTLVLLAALAPIIFLGRLFVDGLGAGARPVLEATGVVPDLDLGRSVAWAGDRTPRRIVPAVIRTNRLPLAAATAILAAVVGLSVSIGGLGSTTVTDVPLGGDGGANAPSIPVSP